MSKYKLSVGILLTISICIYLICMLFKSHDSSQLTSREKVLADTLGSINYNITAIPGYDGYFTVDDTTLEIYRQPDGNYVSLGSMYGEDCPIIIRGAFKSASLERLSKELAKADYHGVYRVTRQDGNNLTLIDINSKTTFDITAENLDEEEGE